jgi:competence protein ComEC
VGIAAWLGGAGILLYHFHTINPLASLWTVLTFPFIVLILTLGLFKLILSFILPTLAALLALPLTALTDGLAAMVSVLSRIQISELVIGHVPVLLVVVYYALILSMVFVHFRRPLPRRIVCLMLLALVLTWTVALKWTRIHFNALRMHVLDVGHGQAVLLQAPPDQNILFDAGSLDREDIGRRIVDPFLRYHGVTRIHGIIISHSDVDHINGIPEILEGVAVERICAGHQFLADIGRWSSAHFLAEILAKQGLEMASIDEFDHNSVHGRLEIIWPPGERSSLSELGDNDLSTVALLEYGGRAIMLCSDIQDAAQKAILHQYPELRADVMLAPHHGSASTLHSGFLEQLDPEVVICSTGRTALDKKRILHPPIGPQVFYTASDGTVTVRITRDGEIDTRSHLK